MKSLSVIGCGTVGQTLAKLWHDKGVFTIASILNKNLDSAFDARKFIGSGDIAQEFHDLRASDVWLIATPDDIIADSCAKLAATGLLHEGNLVFHTSGALTSANLGPAWASRAMTASLHPIKSFVDTKSSVKSFAGTYCTFEGGEEAQKILQPAVKAIEGQFLSIKAENKPLYHAGTTILCNYLCALVDFGLTALEESGVEKGQAIKAVEPILRETMENVLQLGGIEALTGPIARGDVETVRKQSTAIRKKLPKHNDAFNILGLMTSDISEAKGSAAKPNLIDIREILENSQI